jgi:hypothetical protein
MGSGPGLLLTKGLHLVSLWTSGVNVPFIVQRGGGAKGTWSRTMVHFVLGSELEEVDPGSV